MKVKEFIEWLKDQDQEADVLVFVAEYGREGFAAWKQKPFDPLYSEYVDYRGIKRIGKDHPRYGKSQLTLGEDL